MKLFKKYTTHLTIFKSVSEKALHLFNGLDENRGCTLLKAKQMVETLSGELSKRYHDNITTIRSFVEEMRYNSLEVINFVYVHARVA